MAKPEKPCSVEGCEQDASRAANGRLGMCSLHYQRNKKHGDPHIRRETPSPAKDWMRAHANFEGDDCLTYPFHRARDGYGRIHRDNDGPVTTASNYMCGLAHGPAPTDRHEAAHLCGKGHEGCVNPRHLYWATSRQNHADRLKHGTTNRGEQQGASRLKEADVRRIRALRGRRTNQQLADEYGVDPSHICKIQNRQSWRWLD